MCIGELTPLSGELINVWGLDLSRTVATDVSIPEIIRVDEYYIRELGYRYTSQGEDGREEEVFHEYEGRMSVADLMCVIEVE